MVLVELEALDQLERGLDVTCFRDGSGLVELHDRGPGAAGKLAVQSRELQPVLRRLVEVEAGNRRLEHVLITAAERQRAIERGPSRRDLVIVPE